MAKTAKAAKAENDQTKAEDVQTPDAIDGDVGAGEMGAGEMGAGEMGAGDGAASDAASDVANASAPGTANDASAKLKVPAIPAAAAEVLGQITWLLVNSPQHRHLFLTDYDWLILPPVLRKQFRLIRQDEKPVAVVLWAYLSEDAEARMMTGVRKLAPNEWATDGGTPWIFDVVAPFGGHERAIQGVIDSVFTDREVKMLAVDPETNDLVARTVTGKAQAAE